MLTKLKFELDKAKGETQTISVEGRQDFSSLSEGEARKKLAQLQKELLALKDLSFKGAAKFHLGRDIKTLQKLLSSLKEGKFVETKASKIVSNDSLTRIIRPPVERMVNENAMSVRFPVGEESDPQGKAADITIAKALNCEDEMMFDVVESEAAEIQPTEKITREEKTARILKKSRRLPIVRILPPKAKVSSEEETRC